MNTQQISIGGRKRPINFTFEVAYDYERTTGRKYIQDYNQLCAQLAETANRLKTESPNTAGDGISMVLLADMVHTALDYGARKIGQEFEGTPQEVAGWLLSDATAAEQVFMAILESMAPAKKKTTTTTNEAMTTPKKTPARSTGKRS